MGGVKWFISDCHFGHHKIAELRGFVSTDEHDRRIMAGINECVEKTDILYFLGDMFMNPKGTFLDDTMGQIVCQDKRLIRGNHDNKKDVIALISHMTQIYDTKMVKVKGHNCFLSHYPHAYWPESHTGAFHLYGHVHGGREADMDAMMPGRRSMDVGIDTSMELLGQPMPFCDAYVYDTMIQRPCHDCVKGISIAEADARARREHELS